MSAPQSRSLWSLGTGALNAHAITSKLWQRPWLSWKWWQPSYWTYEQLWLFSYNIENNDDHHGRTKESCRTLYWRFWLGKPGQRGVQIGFEKARAHIWALNARPPEYPMPHKAPAVMESDIEWYKAIHVFTGPLLMITEQTKNCFKQRASNEVVQAREGSRPRPNLHLQWFTCNAMIILNAMQSL